MFHNDLDKRQVGDLLGVMLRGINNNKLNLGCYYVKLIQWHLVVTRSSGSSTYWPHPLIIVIGIYIKESGQHTLFMSNYSLQLLLELIM